MRHVALKELPQQISVKSSRMRLNGISMHGEKRARLKGDRVRELSKVKELAEVLPWPVFHPLAVHRGPFPPAGIFLPWNAIPAVEELEFAKWESRHFSW
jgi:hypothetical protein